MLITHPIQGYNSMLFIELGYLCFMKRKKNSFYSSLSTVFSVSLLDIVKNDENGKITEKLIISVNKHLYINPMDINVVEVM